MLPIKTVCALTGVNPVTLRAWERRYGLLEPARTPAGHRQYTHRDVEKIGRILALTRDGVTISQVKSALELEPIPAAPKAAGGPWPGYRRRFAAAIASFDEAALEGIYTEALALHPVALIDRMLLIPMLTELGSRWNQVTGGVAEEHFFSSYVRNKIGARFHHRRMLLNGPKLLAACAPGEQHEIGLLFFSLAAHDAGFRIVHLGAAVPFGEVAAAARRAQCDAVVISHYIERSEPEFYSGLAVLVKQVVRPVYIGGNGVAAREREIKATGAVALGTSVESSVQRLLTEIQGRRGK
jgi:DNA-binding transcriptional MerR regulator/methylmalonyl-CoA mutase cobalamin-binding subunit